MSVDDSADFSKQRRNLIIISSVLILHDFLGINYADFKIFGMQITKGENIAWVLWIMWLYFFVRYFNLFFEVSIEKHNKNYSKFKIPIYTKYIGYLEKHVNKYLSDGEDHPPDMTHIKISNDSHDTFNPYFDEFDYNDSRTETYLSAEDVGLKKCCLYRYFIKALFYYIFKTHYFFEYYFPILFGLLPVLFLLTKTLVSLCLGGK